MVKKPDEIHIEPGAVNMSPTKYGRCACTIKDERAARKVCSMLIRALELLKADILLQSGFMATCGMATVSL